MIIRGNSASFTVQDVTPTNAIPTTPSIELRQKYDTLLAFVTIENGLSLAIVTIDTTFVAIGTYTLILESFDISSGSSLITLKTDTVNIFVTDFIRSVPLENSIVIIEGHQESFSLEHA